MRRGSAFGNILISLRPLRSLCLFLTRRTQSAQRECIREYPNLFASVAIFVSILTRRTQSAQREYIREYPNLFAIFASILVLGHVEMQNFKYHKMSHIPYRDFLEKNSKRDDSIEEYRVSSPH